MKLSAILEDDENMGMVPLIWLRSDDRQELIRDGYQVIPIPGYQQSNGYRAYKVIGPYMPNLYLISDLWIPIWEDWKLTAEYAYIVRIYSSTTSIQMFDRLDDDEKIQVLKYYWDSKTNQYFKKYFVDHPGLLERARSSLNLEELYIDFKELF